MHKYKMEIWQNVNGFTDYQVSNMGRLKSIKRTGSRLSKHGKLYTFTINEKITKGSNHEGTSLVFVLRRDKKTFKRLAHRVVLEAFAGLCPSGKVCCHNNGNPMDNRLENLRWDTLKSNSKDRYKHGTMICGEECNFSKLTKKEVIEIRAYTPRRGLYKDLAKNYCVSWKAIRDIINRRTWKHIHP